MDLSWKKDGHSEMIDQKKPVNDSRLPAFPALLEGSYLIGPSMLRLIRLSPAQCLNQCVLDINCVINYTCQLLRAVYDRGVGQHQHQDEFDSFVDRYPPTYQLDSDRLNLPYHGVLRSNSVDNLMGLLV